MAYSGLATPPQALSLDLDGTLLDESRLQEAIVRTCDRIAATLPGLHASRLAEANAREWAAYWATIEDEWDLGALDGASVQLEAWRRTLRACGCDDESAAQFAARTFRELCRETYALFDDVPELLESAKRARRSARPRHERRFRHSEGEALRPGHRALVRHRGRLRGGWRSEARSSGL